MALVLLILGAALTVAGTACFSWKVALIVAGVLALAGGIDMARDARRPRSEAP